MHSYLYCFTKQAYMYAHDSYKTDNFLTRWSPNMQSRETNSSRRQGNNFQTLSNLMTGNNQNGKCNQEKNITSKRKLNLKRHGYVRASCRWIVVSSFENTL